jgi:putative ABC transport system permease protein
MIGLESIRYSLRNLMHRKARSFFTVLSIFIGIMTIFIFISFGLGLFNYIDDMLSGSSANKIIVQGRGFSAPGLDATFRLEDSDLRAVESSAGVLDAAGVYFKVAKVEYRDEFGYGFATGYDPKKPLIMDVFNVDIEIGRELMSGDTHKVVLGYNYLVDDKIFSKGLKVNDKITINGKELRVVGFYEAIGNPQDDASIYMTEAGIEALYPDEDLTYGWIVGEVDEDRIDWAIENVERNLRSARNQDRGKEDFFVQSFQEMIASYRTVLDIILGFVLLIALISIIVSAVNTANTMITSVIERTKEIGVIKSIGARNGEVLGIFLFESSLLGFIAGVIGVILGWIFSELAGFALDSLGWGFLSPSYSAFTAFIMDFLSRYGLNVPSVPGGFFPYDLFVYCIAFATITGAISGAIPAINASRTNIVDALRYE